MKSQIFNYLTLLFGCITVIVSIYTVISKTSSLLAGICFAITIITYCISRYINYKNKY
ncbi:MAG: hypothetical protein RSE41_01470 [Clostridia bacterium]